MSTLFNAAVQLLFICFALFTFDQTSRRGVHAYRKHSTHRPDTVPVLAIMTKSGVDALHRYVRPGHTRHSLAWA